MKIFTIMWYPHCGTLKKASKNLEGIVDVKIYSSKHLEEEPEKIDTAFQRS